MRKLGSRKTVGIGIRLLDGTIPLTLYGGKSVLWTDFGNQTPEMPPSYSDLKYENNVCYPGGLL